MFCIWRWRLWWLVFCFFFFFFKQKTAYEITRRDWSSDVCSPDLDWPAAHDHVRDERVERRADGGVAGCGTMHDAPARDWNACSGRPGETNVPPRIRQLV